MKKTSFFSILTIILLVSCDSKKNETTLSEAIRINQIGFYPNSVKQFIVADVRAESQQATISSKNWVKSVI